MSYSPDKIRNVMITGHSRSGKTSLTEALLYAVKATDRLGRADDGNTVMDFDPEEIRRKASLSSAVAAVEYDGVKINLVDVPGLFDFELGIHEGIKAVESVLIAISARSGLTVGAQKAYKLAENNGKARMIYISKLDAENADFYRVFEQLKIGLGTSVCPIVVPHMDGKSVIYVNLIEQKAYSYMAGQATEVPMPDMGHRFEGLITSISEAVAETDEALMEKFFEGEPFTQEELTEGVRLGVKTGALTPVLCGVSTSVEAIDMLLRYIKKLLPSAQRAGAMQAGDVEIQVDENAPVSAYVFKTVADPFVGKLSFIKVIGGTIKNDTQVVNARTKEPEKLGKLLFVQGKKQVDAASITAGDIGAITKLQNTRTGDTLCAATNMVNFNSAPFPISTYIMAIKPKQKGDESKIAAAIQRLVEEDGTLTYRLDSETGQQLIAGLGEQHLEVVTAKIKNKFGVEVELAHPKVAYRETIRKKVKAQGRHKKQTGGHGQFGDVVIEFEPADTEELIFEEKVFGGSVPKNFFPAVEKGLRDAVGRGVLAGYPIVGLKATLIEGSYHPVDSSEMAFKMAAKIAYRAALPEALPALLEPIGALKAFVPEAGTGDLMGEVNKRRGRVMGMNPTDDGMQCVEAELPISEMHDFTTYMRQLTQGRGHFTFEFARYELLPSNLEAKVIEDSKKFFADRAEDE